MLNCLSLSRNLQADSKAKVPSLTMQVTKGVWWKLRAGRARRRICASTDRRTRTVCTFTRSGIGVSRGGSRAQLETSSTGLNFKSEYGRCRPMVALIGISTGY